MEYQPDVRALLELSGCKDMPLASYMADIAKGAPDPETAVVRVLASMPAQSPVLEEKWRKYMLELWFDAHPKASKSLCIPLMSKEVAFAPVLVEVYTLLEELHEHPSLLHEDPSHHFLHPSEEARIARELPLFEHDTLHVRRVCALLEELRLVRPYNGYVRVVDSRRREFEALPLPLQYYMLWHCDMYHLDWKEYFHEWGSHLVVFQQYLPMVWESLSRMRAGDIESTDEITSKIVRSFRPMWQQELALGLYEQSSLQNVLEVWLIDKVCARYGFIEAKTPRMFQWTHAGQVMVDLERTAKMPCSTDVLS